MHLPVVLQSTAARVLLQHARVCLFGNTCQFHANVMKINDRLLLDYQPHETIGDAYVQVYALSTMT